MENIKTRLSKIWGNSKFENIQYLKDRGFVFCMNNEQKDILILGMNPSCRNGEEGYQGASFCFSSAIEKGDVYFSPIKRMLLSENNSIDLRQDCAYLDIFSFREKTQDKLKKEILVGDNIQFLVKQLEVTQDTIENVIKPKLIVIKNKEASVYWGLLAEEENIIWMGYDLKYIKDVKNGEYEVGKLYKINGLLDSSQRINSHTITSTNLKGSYVLVTPHINQYLKKEKRPTPKLLKELLSEAKKV